MELIHRLKSGGKVIAEKSTPLPALPGYSASFGQSLKTDTGFSVAVNNTGSATIPYLMIAFFGFTDSSSNPVNITMSSLTCLQPGTSSTVSINVPAGAYRGYRVFMRFPGMQDVLDNKDFLD